MAIKNTPTAIQLAMKKAGFSSSKKPMNKKPMNKKAPVSKNMVQDAFLKNVIETKEIMRFMLITGEEISGIIEKSDDFVLQILNNQGPQILFKHAIINIKYSSNDTKKSTTTKKRIEF